MDLAVCKRKDEVTEVWLSATIFNPFIVDHKTFQTCQDFLVLCRIFFHQEKDSIGHRVSSQRIEYRDARDDDPPRIRGSGDM